MASLQFEGDLSGINARQNEFIREVIEKHGFNNNKVLFEAVGQTGDNFVAVMKRITIVIDGEDDLKMIVKIAPDNETTRALMQNISYAFNNEILMYEEILPRFASLQESVGVAENERLKYAKCYGSLSEPPNQVVLLEDLKQLEYVMLDRLVPLEDSAVRLFLKNLAILHSLSYVLKHLEPETYESLKNRLVNLMDFLNNSDHFQQLMSHSETNALAILDDENYKKHIRGVVSQKATFVTRIKKHDNPQHLVLLHGDAWTSNSMFKLKNGKAVDAILIDYQISSEENPACDILNIIFCCTSYSDRLKLYHDWINYYYQELDKSLLNFGLKASLIYPKDQLDADLKRYSKPAFCMAVMGHGIGVRTSEEAAIAKDAFYANEEKPGASLSIDHLSKETVSLLKSKLIELVDSFRDLGYFES